jgi:hypothetical protein
MSDLRHILEAVAKSTRKRIRKCEHYDSNVCTFTCDAKTPWQLVTVSGHPFSRELTFRKSGRKIDLLANPEYIRIEVKGKRVGAVFSINQPYKILFMKKLDRPGGTNPNLCVYVRDESILPNRIELALRGRSLQIAVKQLIGSDAESLHFFQDAVVLYFKPSDATAVVRAIDTLVSLVGPLEPRRAPIGASALPKELQKLVPLMKGWAESDDGDRAQLLEQASKRSLEKLVRAVEPHLAQIDQYLDSFGERPMPEAATALGTLAECALEARLLLSSKAKT